MEEVKELQRAAERLEARVMSMNNTASVNIRSDGWVAIGVGVIAVVCLVIATSIAWRAGEQAELTQQLTTAQVRLVELQTQQLQARVDMLEARLTLAESRIQRSTK